MPKDYGPPSKPERNQLADERKRDLPRPTLAPRPGPGLSSGIVDASIARAKANRIHERESRITSIDQALKAREGQAKSGLNKAAPDGGATPPTPSKSKQKTGKERTR